MNLSAVFIARPVATTLLTLGVVLAGALAFAKLPVAPLPQVDIPTIAVQANMPGASPETMSSAVATPLERHLGQISAVTEMTSSSSVGSTRVILQFDMSRDIDGAARDVQAAIVASRVDLPAALRANPTYRKFNPADQPVMILAMTSTTRTPGMIYDSAATVLQQKLSQVQGVGNVQLNGSSLPAVRVELNPNALFKYGIGLEDVRAALSAANANSPKGAIEDSVRHLQVYTNDQARTADQYRDLVIAFRNNAAVRLRDLAEVDDSVEDLRNIGLVNGKPAVSIQVFRQPGANIIEVVDRVTAMIPQLKASIPTDIDLFLVNDRSTSIRSSVHDTERTLLISIALVILVVFVFLRDWRATLIPGVVVPVSLVGTFGVMWLLGYTLDILSLMALTIDTGFVVDDAIVVLENTTRHIEAGMPPRKAAFQGASEVGFTVLSMSLSLIAVFIPILFMGGLVGRMFREFAVTLSVAIVVSLAVSLTTTPMMCARFLKHREPAAQPLLFRLSEWAFESVRGFYGSTLGIALRHPVFTMIALVLMVVLNVELFKHATFGLFPQQDNGNIFGGLVLDPGTSFQAASEKMKRYVAIIQEDPAVDTVVANNGDRFFVTLKPLAVRKLSSDQVIARLRKSMAAVQGANLFFQAAQDVRVGGRPGNAQYQYTLQADDLTLLRIWTPKITDALSKVPEMLDVNSDQQNNSPEVELTIDRPTAARLKLTPSQVDNTLYDAFGQRQVTTIYNPLNQYHVVMEVAPKFWQSPETLKDLYVSTSAGAVTGTQSTNAVAGTVVVSKGTALSASAIANDSARNAATNALANSARGGSSNGAAVSTSKETMVPLAAFSSYGPGTAPQQVNHQGHFACATITFNLPPGGALSDAVAVIKRTMDELQVPVGIHGSFQGTAKTFQDSFSNTPFLILAALGTIYIVLGVLYESFMHPLTILSTLPSAGVGAVAALNATGTDLTLIALIGIILLIGIVKKNAIMMIDVALDLERNHGLDSRESIFLACLMRFRPIMMTTAVALLGALPLALGFGEGSELRRPLGISIVGGLLGSQLLTLYTTPVVYLWLDRLRLRHQRRRQAPGAANDHGGNSLVTA